VTLSLLWEEYKSEYPEGYQYTQFCSYFHKFEQSLKLSLRQEHKAGEKVFVDYAGTTVDIVDLETGEARSAQIFVGVLGASSYMYAEATWSQGLSD
jgi:transposase